MSLLSPLSKAVLIAWTPQLAGPKSASLLPEGSGGSGADLGKAQRVGLDAELTQVPLHNDQSARVWPTGREGRVVLSASAREPADGRLSLRLRY